MCAEVLEPRAHAALAKGLQHHWRDETICSRGLTRAMNLLEYVGPFRFPRSTESASAVPFPDISKLRARRLPVWPVQSRAVERALRASVSRPLRLYSSPGKRARP